MAGVTAGSRRKQTSDASKREKRSSADVASLAASIWSARNVSESSKNASENCKLARLFHQASRCDPPYAVGIDAATQKPQAGVYSGLAGSDDAVVAPRARQGGQVIDRNACYAFRHGVAPLVGRPDLVSENVASTIRLRAMTRCAGPPTRRPCCLMSIEFSHRKICHALRCEEHIFHDVFVVGENFSAACHMQEALVEPIRLYRHRAERRRLDAIVVRGNMQPHQWVCVVPMAAGLCRRSMIATVALVCLISVSVDARAVPGQQPHSRLLLAPTYSKPSCPGHINASAFSEERVPGVKVKP